MFRFPVPVSLAQSGSTAGHPSAAELLEPALRQGYTTAFPQLPPVQPLIKFLTVRDLITPSGSTVPFSPTVEYVSLPCPCESGAERIESGPLVSYTSRPRAAPRIADCMSTTSC